MPKHLDDQLNNVLVEVSKGRCAHGVPDKGRCDLPSGHWGPHRIHGQDAKQEEFYQGAYRTGSGEWVLTDPSSVKPVCRECGRS